MQQTKQNKKKILHTYISSTSENSPILMCFRRLSPYITSYKQFSSRFCGFKTIVLVSSEVSLNFISTPKMIQPLKK